jgi:hypothetical protein
MLASQSRDTMPATRLAAIDKNAPEPTRAVSLPVLHVHVSPPHKFK